MTDEELNLILKKHKNLPPDELAKKIGMSPLDFKMRVICMALEQK